MILYGSYTNGDQKAFGKQIFGLVYRKLSEMVCISNLCKNVLPNILQSILNDIKTLIHGIS